MKNLLILLVSIVLLSSCVTQRRCMEKFPPPPNDTIINTKIVETIRDTTITITIPGETTVDTTEVIVERETGIVNMPMRRLDTKHAYATIEIRNGQVYFLLHQKESEIETTIQDAIREYVENNTTTIIEYVYVPVEFTWWETLYLNIGKITFIVLSTLTGASIGFFLLKLKFPGLKLW